MKNLSQDAERTVLIIPDTPSSDGSRERPTTTRSFSLNKVFFSSLNKVTSSLPVTPMANLGPESVPDRQLESHSEFAVSDPRLFLSHHLRILNLLVMHAYKTLFLTDQILDVLMLVFLTTLHVINVSDN